jgi:hypothetical protein
MDPRAIRLRSMLNPLETTGSRQDGALPHTPLSCGCLRGAFRASWQSLHPAPAWQSPHAAPSWQSLLCATVDARRRAMATPAPRTSRRSRAHAPGQARREQGRVPPSAAAGVPWQSLDSGLAWQSLHAAPGGRVFTLPAVAES